MVSIIAKMNRMNRKQFIESYGATCSNWRNSWSFVNHEKKFVVFGAWDVHISEDEKVLIFSDDWKGKSSGYSQSVEHLQLIQKNGYQLKVFPMEYSQQRDEEDSPSKIKRFNPSLRDMDLVQEGINWYALSKEPEDKVARICWNSEYWEKPSGPEGKSRNVDSYEYQNSYGSEEWLLDSKKLIDGYHYGFVRAISAHRDLYSGKIFNLSLYSINGRTKQCWWLGEIKNVHVVDTAESSIVYDIYKSNGWVDEMRDQLINVNANVDAFDENLNPDHFAIIKFRPEDKCLENEPLEIEPDDPAITSTHYVLLNKGLEPKLPAKNGIQFSSGHVERKQGTVSFYNQHSCEVDLLHNKMQTALYEELVKTYGRENIGTEKTTRNGTRVDIIVKTKVNYDLYEIKTSISALRCVREALGQLLEYAHYRNDDAPDNLIVVGPSALDKMGVDYMKTLNSKYKLNISYKQFNIEDIR